MLLPKGHPQQLETQVPKTGHKAAAQGGGGEGGQEVGGGVEGHVQGLVVLGQVDEGHAGEGQVDAAHAQEAPDDPDGVEKQPAG